MKGEWLRKSQSIAVVFVHGVLSSGETCWRNDGGTFWPDLLLAEPAYEDVGVYLYSYRTTFFSGTYRLGDVVDDLKERVKLDDLDSCRAIIFVAHSMGGIVVRKLLVERAADFAHIELGLFLVASPSLGSDYANFLSPLARLFGHSHADALRFSQDNAWLMDLNKEFKNLKENGRLSMSGKELVEDVFVVLPSLIRRQVVQPFSGALYFGEPYKVPASNHFSIAKPDGPEAIQHRMLLDFIKSVRPRLSVSIEEELKGRLERRLAACLENGVPFRSFHKLDALLSMRSGFARNCIDQIKPGGADEVAEWLRAAVREQLGREADAGSSTASLAKDPTVARAAGIAEAERAPLVDERHLLLATLAEEESGTVAELSVYLEGRLDLLVAVATRRRPQAAELGRTPIRGLRRNGRP